MDNTTPHTRLHVTRTHEDVRCPKCHAVVFASNLLPDVDALTRELATVGAMDFHARYNSHTARSRRTAHRWL
jgi:hypothetical protein